MASSKAQPVSAPVVDEMDPAELELDLKNPRMPDTLFKSESDAIRYLAKFGALDEIVSSITSSGWLDFEPLIVLEHDPDLDLNNVVIEGNRRLAVLRLLSDPELAKELRVAVPKDSRARVPSKVRVWRVKSRSQARGFIGYKHINGAYRWNSYAKAKFAADWLREDSAATVDTISEQLGDSHSTVLRLVNGYKVFRQAEVAGKVRPDLGEKFAFSHLYVGLTRPGIRSFIGLGSVSSLLPDDPVPTDRVEELGELMVWLYGSQSTPSVIRSQNPDLKDLAEVVSNERAVGVLRDRLDLRIAYDVVEDKGELFTRELDRLLTSAKTATGLLGHYDGTPGPLEQAELANKTLNGLVAAMRAARSE